MVDAGFRLNPDVDFSKPVLLEALQLALSKSNLPLVEAILTLPSLLDGSTAAQILQLHPSGLSSDSHRPLHLNLLDLLPPLPATWPPESGGKVPAPQTQQIETAMRLVRLGPSCIAFESARDSNGCTLLHKVPTDCFA
jgi:hypothetical protein